MTTKSSKSAAPAETAKRSRLRELTAEYRALADKLRAGGGAERVAKMHAQGKLSPRERVAALLDPGTPWV
ncbi:MAG: methylcrotonoyl-CoA carboxylase, partial [Gemmatimonadales bacterium]